MAHQRYAIAIVIDGEKPNPPYLTGEDGDGLIFTPLYHSEDDANTAAQQSDLDEWDVVPVDLPD